MPPPKGGPPGQAKGRKRKDSDTESNGSEKKDTVSFEVYQSHASTFQNTEEYQKSIDAYTKALELRPGDRNCLVARSQCYLQLGNSEASLKDAEEVLKEDKDNIKGLFQKAEALYQKGDFEFALMFYHRGHKLRSEVKGFRLGIQKSQEAIDNSIGDSAGIHLENKGDLSFFQKDEQAKGKPKPKQGYSKPPVAKREERKERRVRSAKDSKTVKQLLGELYADKEYLENLLKETENAGRQTETNEAIRDLCIEGLEYLDTRTEFWQQQKPMYSRKRDKKVRESAVGGRGGKKDPAQYILKSLEEIDEAQADGKHEESLKQAKKTLKDVEKWSDDDVPNRAEVIANLHSFIGNAYLELGDYNKALEHHNKDREIGSQNDLPDAYSRSLDNLGRVYARMGKFDEAVEVWEEKLPLSKSALESTWLYHEIGRCYLEQKQYDKARDYGEKSMKAAQEAEDGVWQLNASVLIAQAEVKLGDYNAALDTFDNCLKMAQTQGDKTAESAIKKAINDVNNRIAKGLKGDEEDPDADKKEEKKKDKDQQAVKGGEDDADDKKDDDDDEVDSPPGDTHGTVKDHPGFNAEDDVEAIKEALKGWNNDESALIDILANRSNKQRLEIRKKFQEKEDKDIVDELKSELKGDFEDIVVGLFMPAIEFDAFCLQDAVKGIGTDESTLNTIIVTRNKQQLADIKKKYKEMNNKELADAIKGDTSGDYQELMLELLKGERDQSNKVSLKKAKKSANRLYQDGKKDPKPTDDDFREILTKTNKQQIKKIFEEYKKLAGQDIVDGVRKAMKGDSEESFVALVNAIQDGTRFYAECLENAMKGIGTNESTLVRIIVARAEIDLAEIKQQYKELYKRTLDDAIENECKGDFKKMLVAIVKDI